MGAMQSLDFYHDGDDDADGSSNSGRKCDPSKRAVRKQAIIDQLRHKQVTVRHLDITGNVLLSLIATPMVEGSVIRSAISPWEPAGLAKEPDGTVHTVDYVPAKQAQRVGLDDFCQSLLANDGLEAIKLETLPALAKYPIPSDDEYLQKIDQIASTLGSMAHLQEIRLSGVVNMSLHLRSVARILETTRQISSFTLSWDRTIQKEPDYEMSLVAAAIQNHPHLKSLKLRHFSPSLATTHTIFPALLTLPQLEEFVFEGVPKRQYDYFTCTGWIEKFICLPTIRRVRFANILLTKESIAAFSHALDINKEDRPSGLLRSPLTELTLCRCLFPESGAESLVRTVFNDESMTSVKKLVLNVVCQIYAPILDVLAECNVAVTAMETTRFCPLIELDLEGCQVPVKARDSLVRWFKSLAHDSQLQVLSLPTFAWDDGLCRALRHGLEKNAKLKTLKIIALYQNWEAQLTDDNWKLIHPFLSVNKALESLHVVSRRLIRELLSDETIRLLSSDSVALRHLSIDAHEPAFDGRGLVRLIGALSAKRQQHPLQRLSLRPVRVTSKSDAQALLQAVFENYQLTSLDGVRFSCLTLPYDRLIQGILVMNRAGRKALLENDHRIAGVNVLLAAGDNLDCLFLHVRECPHLFRRDYGGENDLDAS